MLSICTCRLRKHWHQPWRHAFPLFAALRCKDLVLYCIVLYCIVLYWSHVFPLLAAVRSKDVILQLAFCAPIHSMMQSGPLLAGLIVNIKANLNSVQNIWGYRSKNLLFYRTQSCPKVGLAGLEWSSRKVSSWTWNADPWVHLFCEYKSLQTSVWNHYHLYWACVLDKCNINVRIGLISKMWFDLCLQ